MSEGGLWQHVREGGLAGLTWTEPGVMGAGVLAQLLMQKR
jgi:hypothetical protein